MKKITSEQFMSLSALLTAVVAVLIGVMELRTNREHQELSVEPYLMLANSNLNVYEMLLTNKGLGPARIGTVEVTIGGSTINNWHEAVKSVTGVEEVALRYSNISKGQQLKSGEVVTLLHIADKKTAALFHRGLSAVDMEICYCSIYKKCWVIRNEKIHQPVAQCSNDAGTRF